MKDKRFQFISAIPAFSILPKEKVRSIAKNLSVKEFPKDTVLSEQGKTDIRNVIIIRDGILELYASQGEEMLMLQRLQSGEIYGGTSILMNAGKALRSARVKKHLHCYTIPKERFIALSAGSNSFHDFFADEYKQKMRDKAYASIIAAAQAPNFLSNIVPFSFLSKEDIENVAKEISIAHYPSDTVLLVQGESTVENLYIIKQGAADRYYEKEKGQTIHRLMGEGEVYGGISMLVNNSIAVRSFRTIEDSFFYLLPRKMFLDICAGHKLFVEYFTNTFGKRMLNRSYAQIISQHYRPNKRDLTFFSQTVSGIYQENLVVCPQTASVRQTAKKMRQNRCSSIFIHDDQGHVIGIATDSDLCKKVIADGFDPEQPVSGIMSSPLHAIASDSLVFEAIMTMMKTKIKHLAVSNADGKVVGMITHRDLINAQGQYPIFMIRMISDAERVEDVVDKYRNLPHLIHSLIQNGAKPRNVTRMITTIYDAIIEKIIELAIAAVGPPPVTFSFMILGSQGRKEQTLKTDQDNAIIYEDVEKAEDPEVREYFLALGTRVCDWLNDAGISYCKGGVMAKNPQWCLPLLEWKQQFYKWIHTAEPEALLQSSIFFDFRSSYGDEGLIEQLRHFLFASLAEWPGFFRHLTENALFFKPPIGFFRNFVVESKGEHRNQFDIKSAMLPIVDFARIYGLKNKITETNTIQRLYQLFEAGIMTETDYRDLNQAYSFLMQLRFMQQIKKILSEGQAPDNYVNPKKLSPIEQTMLKEVFKRLEKCQSKLGYDFT